MSTHAHANTLNGHERGLLPDTEPTAQLTPRSPCPSQSAGLAASDAHNSATAWLAYVARSQPTEPSPSSTRCASAQPPSPGSKSLPPAASTPISPPSVSNTGEPLDPSNTSALSANESLRSARTSAARAFESIFAGKPSG